MRRPAGWLFLALTLGGASSWWAGAALVAPAPAPVGAPPSYLPAETVQIPSRSGSLLRGWLAQGDPALGGVLLLHGSGGDRRSMLGRARFLYRAGYSVLLVDLQAHGESPGERMTLGRLEARDAEAALGFIKARLGGRPVALIGFSLGGAAALLGDAARDADALVLEAVYGTLDEAVANRLELRLGEPGRWLAPLLLWQVRPRLGAGPDAFRPVDRIGRIRAPVLIVAGTEDRRATPADARRLLANAPSAKSLWLVPGAAHQDFHALDPVGYEHRVLDLLRDPLGRPTRGN